MPRLRFDDDVMRTTRLVLCPTCDSEFRVPLTALEYCCGSCGEVFSIEPEGSYPEEFIWRPGEKY